jgi:predicted acetyltransferase
MVGTFGVQTFKTNVAPGPTPNWMGTGGITVVTVSATHRRRGILTSMMRRGLDDIRDRGEPLASLYSSEPAIYGRFGFGDSVRREQFKIERQHVALIDNTATNGSLGFISLDNAEAIIRPICDAVGETRSGWIRRDDNEWMLRLRDPERDRGGATERYCLVHEAVDGTPDAYALYKRSGDGHRDLLVEELLATNREAYRGLWQYCLNVDLVNEISAKQRPLDDALPWMLEDPRMLRRLRQDAVWTRLVDVGRALGERSYITDGRLVIEIMDEFCPWNSGVYELVGGPDGAACKRTSVSPQLRLPVQSLGAIYFGNVRPSVIARAGLIDELSQGAVARADSLFQTRLAPWCIVDF